MPRARKRRAFRADADATAEPVLDEQQQEEVVQTLTAENQQSNARWLEILRIFIICGGLINVAGLAIITRASLLGEEPILFTGTPIPFAPLFALLSLILTATCHHITGNAPRLPYFARLTHEHLTIVSLAAPALSFFLGKHRSQTFWWFSETALIGICTTVHSILVESSKGPDELNNLKYDLKGA